MTRNKRTAAYFFAWVCLFNVCFLSSCRYHTEPEQVYPVSAMGFDRVEEGIRVTVEIAMETGEKSAVCFSQTGERVATALQDLAYGLPRALIFSHCALAVLGEELTKAQMQEIFAFAGVEDGLPLAAEVVISQNAEALLRSERLSSIAAGYEIPQILEQERIRRGVELPCQIYRLRSVFSPNLPVTLPRLERSDEMPTVRFVGLEILRPNAPSYRLDAADCLSHAILTNTCADGTENGIFWKVLLEKLVIAEDGEIVLNLRLELEGGSPEEQTLLLEELQRKTEDLYQRATEATGEDLFWLGQRMEGVPWSSDMKLTVKCEVR